MVTATIAGRRRGADPARKKSKRVRTGCLTCRERHLKCDEATPDCLNCRKGNRQCRRGLRVNFLDIHVVELRDTPFASEWAVAFQDESREIASEYRGGLRRYDTAKKMMSMSISACNASECTTKHNGNLTEPNRLCTTSETPSHESIARFVPDNVGGPIVRRFRAGASRSSQPRVATSVSARSSGIKMGRATPSYPTSLSRTHGSPTPLPLSRRFLPLSPPDRPKQDKIKQESMSPPMRPNDLYSIASIMPQATQVSASSKHDPLFNASPDEMAALSPLVESSQNGEREYLRSSEEVQWMQTFVEEIGEWMDSFHPSKHFSQITPYHALKSPMLLNACLSCTMKHQSPGSPKSSDKALSYYNTSTTQLLRSLQNPDRNISECATAAIILNVYEIMSDTQTQRMNHIAGARALIRECGWNATSTGVGATCFWLNIEMEVMNCLARNWHTTWDPDEWGVDMCMGDEEDVSSIGKEETWIHKIFYIMAKVANFRAAASSGYLELSPQRESFKQGARLVQWEELKNMCTKWDHSCPRTMHPIGYVDKSENASSDSSNFPKIWLIKRAAVISRLFYHTTLCVLAQTAPAESHRPAISWHESQVHHARQVCGIVCHSKDRGIASSAVRCLATVATVLTSQGEHEEIMQALNKISLESGLQVSSIKASLRAAWGAKGGFSSALSSPIRAYGHDHQHSNHQPLHQQPQHQQQHSQHPSADKIAGLVDIEVSNSAPQLEGPNTTNPLRCADFKLPNHPYQNWYEPPNKSNTLSPPLF